MKVFKDKCPNVSSVLIVAGGYDSVVSENVEYLKVWFLIYQNDALG